MCITLNGRPLSSTLRPMSRKKTGSCDSTRTVFYFPPERIFRDIYNMLCLGRIPVLIDNHQSPPFTVMETSAELLYLLKFADKDDKFGFKDELERSQCLQWLFFWHGSGAPYQGQVNHFNRFAQEKIPCMIDFCISSELSLFDACLLQNKLIRIVFSHQTPSIALKTKRFASMECSRSSFRENIQAPHVNTLPGPVPVNTRLRILAHGRGLRDGSLPGSVAKI